MKKLFLLPILVLSLSGCAGLGCKCDPIIKTEYVIQKTPVPAAPMPPEVPKPVLETGKLTKEDRENIGIVGKAIVVENKQLKGYISILEAIIAKYKDIASKSADRVDLDIDIEKLLREQESKK